LAWDHVKVILDHLKVIYSHFHKTRGPIHMTSDAVKVTESRFHEPTRQILPVAPRKKVAWDVVKVIQGN